MPRLDHARALLALFKTDHIGTVGLFAPQGRGKSEFLQRDVRDEGEDQGYQVLYVDLGSNRQDPGAVLVRALEIAADCVGAVGTQAGTTAAGCAWQAQRIEDLVRQVTIRGRLLLLLDNAQALAQNKRTARVAQGLVNSLRLAERRARTVLACTTRAQLTHKLLHQPEAALYELGVGTLLWELPSWEPDMIEDVAGQFRHATGRAVDPGALWSAYERLDRLPGPFMQAVLALVFDPGLTLEQAIQAPLQLLERAQACADTWADLDALQRQLILLVAREPACRPFSKEARQAMAKALQLDAVDASQVQRALIALEARGLLGKGAGGGPAFEDEAFSRWVSRLPLQTTGQNLASRPSRECA